MGHNLLEYAVNRTLSVCDWVREKETNERERVEEHKWRACKQTPLTRVPHRKEEVNFMCESVAAQDGVRNIIERARNLKRSLTKALISAVMVRLR